APAAADAKNPNVDVAKKDNAAPLPEQRPVPGFVPRTAEQEKAIAILRQHNATFQPDHPGRPIVHIAFKPEAEVDGILKDLLPLTEVDNLSLQGTKVTDAGLKHVAGFRKLHQLYLGQTAITDVGVKHLAPCEQLRHLGLENTRVTDAGIKALANLQNLR